MEHFLPSRGSGVISRAEDIRDRLSNALRLVNEIVSETEACRSERPVTEDYVRALLKLRRERERFFDGGLFADPAWDILLDLYAAELGQQRMTVGNLSIGAAVPATTALRWIGVLEREGLVKKRPDPLDGRRIFVALEVGAVASMDQFFARVPTRPLPL